MTRNRRSYLKIAMIDRYTIIVLIFWRNSKITVFFYNGSVDEFRKLWIIYQPGMFLRGLHYWNGRDNANSLHITRDRYIEGAEQVGKNSLKKYRLSIRLTLYGILTYKSDVTAISSFSLFLPSLSDIICTRIIIRYSAKTASFQNLCGR